MKARLDLRLEEYELEILDTYCKAFGRTRSDVLREFIRSLAKKKKPSQKDGALDPFFR